MLLLAVYLNFSIARPSGKKACLRIAAVLYSPQSIFTSGRYAMSRRRQISGLVLTIALSCTLSFSESLFAQQGSRRSSGREAYEQQKARDRNLQNRTMQMQHAGDADKKSISDEQLKALVGRMKEDFRRLQIVNNSMMQKVSGSDVLDYKNVLGATDEINKCAKRLQTLLSASDNGDNKKGETKTTFDSKEMRTALFRLDDLIMSFVTSPLFKNLVDIENAEKARRDLTGIIDLSSLIRKNAEKLNRTPKS